jgi:nucleotide-binding universal stress UspA family protein
MNQPKLMKMGEIKMNRVMDNNNLVLVPFDFSEVADYAVQHAIGTAKWSDYKICLLHLINKDIDKSYLKDETFLEEAIIKKINEITLDKKIRYNVDIDFIIRENNDIYNTIGDAAKETGASFIIIGTHGKKGMQHIIGSYILKVISNSPVPVIVVQKRPFGKGYENIVAPIDITANSIQKVKWAAKLAQHFNSTVHLISLDTTSKYRQQIYKNVTLIKELFDKKDIKYTEKVISCHKNEFVAEVINHAVQINADLLLIINEANKFVPGFMKVSAIEKIIFNSNKIPVMCINPENYTTIA